MTDYDIIANSEPIDKTAAMIAQKGEHYTPPELKYKVIISHVPLNTRRYVSTRENQTGKRFGNLVVTGFYKSVGGRNIWAVRCDCGIYTTKKAKSLYTKNKESLCCPYCQHLKSLKKKGETIKKKNPKNEVRRLLYEHGIGEKQNYGFTDEGIK